MGMHLGLGCLPNDLKPEDPPGKVAEGSQQAVTPEGPVCWPFGVPEPEEVDKGKEAYYVDKVEEDKGTPEE